MSAIIVTGATGFIGRLLVPLLRQEGSQLHLFGREPHGPASVTWHQIDLLEDDPRPLCEQINARQLIHLAWTTEPGHYQTAPENLDWVASSLRLVRAFSSAGGEHVVAIGSAFEGKSATLYAVAKQALHATLDAGASALGIRLAWAVVHQLYGPGEAPGRLIPSLVRQLLDGDPVAVGDGRHQRDFVHVDDVARAIAALSIEHATGTFDVGTGRAVPVADVIQLVAAEAGRPDLIRWGARDAGPVDEPPLLRADPQAILTAVGWTAQIAVEDGIREIVAAERRVRTP